MSQFGAMTPPPQVESKTTDQRTLVAAIDPSWKDPIEIYVFPNGRKFTEPQNDPAGYD
jgi:hypothetical protein